MVKLILSNQKMVTLKRGNKTITRSELDYETNKSMYDFRGFAPVDAVKKEIKKSKISDIVDKVVQLKPKKKTRKKK